MKIPAAWSCLILSLSLLAACKRTPPPEEGFTLDQDELTFSVLQNQPMPPPQRLRLKVLDPQAVLVGSGPAAGSVAPWLRSTVEGRAPDVAVVVSVTNTGLKPGDYTGHLTVATGDEKQNILKSRDVTVKYRVLRP